MIWNYAFCVVIYLAISSAASQQSGSQPENSQTVDGFQEIENNSQRVKAANICSDCGMKIKYFTNRFIPNYGCAYVAHCDSSRKKRIVDGFSAEHSEFPSLVKLTHDEGHFCGGTLISPNHVLTVAHCVKNRGETSWRIKFADASRRSSKALHIHPSYNKYTYENDIAIITMDNPVQLDSRIKRVCLPSEGQDFNGTNGIAVGWGYTSENNKSNTLLHQADLPIMTVEECAQSSYSADRLNKNIFCAGYMYGGRDTCKGDSGGPMYVRVRGIPVLAGVISNGRGCARDRYPGLNVKVINYLSWIRQNIDDQCICMYEEMDTV